MKRPAKGTIFISNVKKAMEHEWFVEAVDKNEFDLDFVLFNSKDSELFHFIRNKGFKCTNYSLRSKFHVPLYIILFTVKFLFRRVDFVHCHLFEATLIGIISSRFAGIKKRIYTRHHSDFHHTYHSQAVKYDLIANNYSTHIIAVSISVKKLLIEKENVPENKIIVVPHGIPEALLNPKINEQSVNAIKTKYQLTGHHPVIGVISRFTEWKGVQYTIPAFKNLMRDFPDAKLILANAGGDYAQQIQSLLKELPADSFRIIKFEADINALFKSFDVFVHVPVDPVCEAFGQVYIEALNLGAPMVCTLSGVANELVKDNVNALVADYRNSSSIYQQVKKILDNQALRQKLVENGRRDVKEYTFESKFQKLKSIYLA